MHCELLPVSFICFFLIALINPVVKTYGNTSSGCQPIISSTSELHCLQINAYIAITSYHSMEIQKLIDWSFASGNHFSTNVDLPVKAGAVLNLMHIWNISVALLAYAAYDAITSIVYCKHVRVARTQTKRFRIFGWKCSVLTLICFDVAVGFTPLTRKLV